MERSRLASPASATAQPLGASHAIGLEVLATLRDGRPLPQERVQSLLAAVGEAPPAASWHPTGFLVVRVAHDDAGALRLHLWPEEAREHGRPCWPVHDHVWDLRSRVLCGVVQSVEYSVHEDSHGESALYSVEYGGDHRSRMHHSGRRVRLEEHTVTSLTAGEHYCVHAGEFHTSRVEPGTLAATLVATRLTDRVAPWVVGVADGPTQVPVVRTAVSSAHVAQLLRRVRASLAAAG